jgi:hypothetical protein
MVNQRAYMKVMTTVAQRGDHLAEA